MMLKYPFNDDQLMAFCRYYYHPSMTWEEFRSLVRDKIENFPVYDQQPNSALKCRFLRVVNGE